MRIPTHQNTPSVSLLQLSPCRLFITTSDYVDQSYTQRDIFSHPYLEEPITAAHYPHLLSRTSVNRLDIGQEREQSQ